MRSVGRKDYGLRRFLPSGPAHKICLRTFCARFSGAVFAIAHLRNADPPGGFNGHWITLYNAQYYDPSYGTIKVTGANKNKAYEDASLAGYGIGVVNCRKNDVSPTSSSELDYTVDN